MELLKKNEALIVISLLSFILGGIVLLTVSRLRQETPVAPTAPIPQQAIEGSPVPACQLSFAITLPTPTPTPSVTPSPSATPTPTPSVSPSASPGVSPSLVPSASPSPTSSPTPTPSGSPSPTPTSSPSPTPSPTPIAQCVNIKVYQIVNGQWVLVPTLSALRPGDVIYIAVLGTTTGGTFDMAHFRVNGLPANWAESALVNPFGEFYYQYTLLPGVASYALEAEIHHVTLGWR